MRKAGMFLAAVCCWCLLGTARAQSYYQVGFGSTNILDTYLSQEKFKGTGITLLNMREHRKLLSFPQQDGDGQNDGDDFNDACFFVRFHKILLKGSVFSFGRKQSA